jgi:hypothetical protein
LPSQSEQLAWAIAAKTSTNFFDCRSQAHLLFQGSRAIRDPKVVDYINKIFKTDLLANGLNQGNNLNQFKQSMLPWIRAHRTNSIIGLEEYQVDFSAGTTQSFDSFYYRHRDRRMRCLVGEYFYHLKTWISNDTAWSFITDSDPLMPGDAVVVSAPFCDTGSKHPQFDQLIAECNRLKIPVLVDCCYYTISGNVHLDLTDECIDTVAFSLSKAFPIANLRIGARYTRSAVFDGQKLHDSINYNNNLSAYIGLEIIRKFSSDYIFNNYRQKQIELCQYFDLEPSNSVMFAVGDRQWSRYNRSNLLKSYQLDLDADRFQNRICLASVFDNWNLFEYIKDESHTTI